MRAKLYKTREIPSKYAAAAALLCIFILLVFTACKSESKVVDADKNVIKLSDKVEDLRRQIAHDNYMGTEFIARKQQVDSAYLRKQELMHIATDDELIDLTGDPSAVVSLTAFQGLYNRGKSVVPIIFNGYKSRIDRIRFLKGDLLMEMPMLEYAYVHILNYQMSDDEFHDENPENAPKFKLSAKEQMEVVLIIEELRSRE